MVHSWFNVSIDDRIVIMVNYNVSYEDCIYHFDDSVGILLIIKGLHAYYYNFNNLNFPMVDDYTIQVVFDDVAIDYSWSEIEKEKVDEN